MHIKQTNNISGYTTILLVLTLKLLEADVLLSGMVSLNGSFWSLRIWWIASYGWHNILSVAIFQHSPVILYLDSTFILPLSHHSTPFVSTRDTILLTQLLSYLEEMLQTAKTNINFISMLTFLGKF